MQHFDKATTSAIAAASSKRIGRPILAAMSHSDLITLQSNQRLITPPPSPPPTAATATPLLLLQLQQQPLPTTILRHRYQHIDDSDNDNNDIDHLITETSFMQPNIATTKVYSDHEINYYSNNSYHHDDNNITATVAITATATSPTTTRTDNITTTTTTAATIEHHDDMTCYQNDTQHEQIIDKHDQHLYHTL